MIFSCGKTNAKNLLISCANAAVKSVLDNNKFDFTDISKDNENNITGIEVNSSCLNLFKSAVLSELSENIKKYEMYKISIPIGTILGSEYFNCLGPNINFSLQMSHIENIDIKSNFYDTGINGIIHRIYILVNMQGNILIIGSSDSFTASSEYLVSETVINGKVPDSFTNVEEYPGSDTADDIFNYAK